MADLISYPFRLDSSGSVATVEQDSDAQLAQEVAVGILTRPEERPFIPDFGIADPAFVGFDADALRLQVATYGPPIDVAGVEVTIVDDRRQDVVVQFTSTDD